MCVYTCITCSTSQRFIVLVGDVLTSLGISVPFGQAKVNHVNLVLFFINSYQEVVRFHVPMDKVIVMQILDPLYHLVSQHDYSLVAELPLAVDKQVFQAGA